MRLGITFGGIFARQGNREIKEHTRLCEAVHGMDWALSQDEKAFVASMREWLKKGEAIASTDLARLCALYERAQGDMTW